jgi:hypothetical protein
MVVCAGARLEIKISNSFEDRLLFAMSGSSSSDRDLSERLASLALSLEAVGATLVALALLFLGSGFWLDQARTILAEQVLADRQLGPIEIREPNSVVTITLAHTPREQSWAYVQAALIDDGGTAVLAFGDEFYRKTAAAGSNPTPPNTETRVKLLLPKPGVYSLRFLAEGADAGALDPRDLGATARLDLKVERHRGSARYFLLTGWCLLAVGLLLGLSGVRKGWKGWGSRLLARPGPALAAAIPLLALYALLQLFDPSVSQAQGQPRMLAGSTSIFVNSPSLRESSLAGPGRLGGGLMEGK